jgi:hypothetical protein
MKIADRLIIVILTLMLLWLTGEPSTSRAQIPAEFADLYPLMQTDITNFEATVDAGWNGVRTNCQFASVLLPATDGGEGAAVTNTSYFKNAVLPFLNGLTNVGITEVKFSIDFPTLYQPYYNSTNGLNDPGGYTNMLDFFTNVVAECRTRGLKIIIPTQNVFPVEQPAISNYYSSLTFADYTNGRSAQIQSIARVLKPDYLLVQSEPITEVDNLAPGNPALSADLDDPVTDTNMLMGFLNDLQRAGLRTTNLIVGAGMGTWQPQFDTYLTNFVNLPLDILDVHVYPINNTTNLGVNQNFLTRILTMADAAHSHGIKVGMGECWLQKERDSELSSNLSILLYQGRDAYSFWAPLDEEFLLCMVKVGHWKQFEFIDPFWTDFYFSYLDFTNEQSKITGLPDEGTTVLVADEDLAVYAALAAGNVTNTGVAYAEYIRTNNPSLRISPTNGNWLNLAWTPVAEHYLLRSASQITTNQWAPLSFPVRDVGTDYSTTVQETNSEEFFQLYLP